MVKKGEDSQGRQTIYLCGKLFQARLEEWDNPAREEKKVFAKESRCSKSEIELRLAKQL